MKKGLLLFSLFMVTSLLYAVPAKRGVWKTIKLSDGTEVRVELKGDEHLRWYQAEDGKCYVQTAELNGYTAMAEADLQAQSVARRSLHEARRVKNIHRVGEKPAQPITGHKKGLVILVEYQDTKFANGHNKAQFNRILNEEGYKEGNFKGSVKDYFKAQSDGSFILDFDVVGPVTLKNKQAYYGGNNAYGRGDLRPGEMTAEACLAVVDSVNFADYDWGGDGEVDQVYILYAGKGEADGGDASTIWPHEWQLKWSDYAQTLTLDNVTVNTYACGSELNGSGNISGIGTFCHEFSHCLGYPDFYDTQSGGNYGMGSWDLMDNGSYNADGYQPAGYTSYERIFAGWLNPIELKDDMSVTGMKAINNKGDAYIIYNKGNNNEYYLLENRQKTNWDASLPNSGLLILHVDYDAGAWRSNTVNATSTTSGAHQRLTIFHADNKATMYDQASDTYPYFAKNELSNTSLPAARVYNTNSNGRQFMNISITNIKKNTDGTVSFDFKNIKPLSEQGGKTVFYETFDNCKGSGGNDFVWNKGANSVFRPDSTGWESVKPYGAKSCARFGSGTEPGVVTTPEFTIDGETVFSFVAAPWGTDATGLTLSIESGDATLSQETFTMVANGWTECTTKITGNGKVKVKFTPVGRLFLDDVIAVSGVLDGISEVVIPSTQKVVDNRIYSIDGRYVGTDFNSLKRGIYIINGKKVIK